jgi:predicted nucleotidyltransferase
MGRISDVQDPEAVLSAAVEAASERFGDRLLAAYAIGSLAHGGFCPLVSDVDLAIVIADPLDDEDQAHADAITDEIRAEGGLAARLSLFWASPTTLVGREPGGRLPAVDRLDLATHGRVLRGAFDLDTVTRPSSDELIVEAVRFAVDKLSLRSVMAELRDPAALVAQGARHLTKRVLFPVRFLYTAATGAIGRNEAAVDWYARTEHPARDLVAAAGRWRTEPLDVGEAERLVGAEILPLYEHFLEEHLALMERMGEPGLATHLQAWRAALCGPAATPSPAAKGRVPGRGRGR